LRHYTARKLNDLLLGTVASATSGAFVCALAGWEVPDDHFNKWVQVYCYSGIGAGTSGNPTDWVNSTHTLTFLPAATLTAADLVEMHQQYTTTQYKDAINLAIEQVAADILIPDVDTSTTLAASTWQYTIPTDVVAIHRLDMESGTSGMYRSIKQYDDKDELGINPRYWRILSGATPTIEFDYDLFNSYLTADRTLRIMGFASQATLSAESDTCQIPPNIIANLAAAEIHSWYIKGRDVDTDWHEGQYKLRKAEAEVEKLRSSTSLPQGTRWVI